MGHSFTDLLIHAVWSTKNREPLIASDIQARLHEYIGGICRAEHCSLLAINSMPDHAHLLILVHQSISVADLMRTIKSRTSGWIHDTFPAHSDFEWQAGYGAFSVSQSNREQVISYIAKQQEHHKARDFKEEFLELLRRHNIQFDERYVWS